MINLILRKADDKATCHKLLASEPRMKCNNATTHSALENINY